ncbi:MAG TPA: ATP-binding protein [Polyangiaceae bacterium]|nr:ATP-binding protein [Polyangiaceae bacterium]
MTDSSIQPALAAAPLARRLAWATGFRLLILSLVLGLLGILNFKSPLAWTTFTVQTALCTLALAFAVTGLYATLLRSGRQMQLLVTLQLIVDPLLWTMIVYLSGGASSGATSLYGLSCVTGAMLTGFRGALLTFGVSVVCFGGLLLSLGLGWVAPPSDQPAAVYHLATEDLLYAGVVNLLAMFVVTVLAGSLAERLRVAGGRLVAAEERADHAERLAALGRVATALAHEIRNPLGSISGCIQLLRVNRALSEEDQRLCAIIVSEASRLNDLVSDMMNLARPQRPQLSCVDAVATAREVVQLAAQSGRAVSDVRISCSGAEQALICADSAQLRQLIWNLVRNAVQASRAGSEVRVSVNTQKGLDHELAELLVQDDGVGLSEQARERIFDAFFTTRAQGTGVGLAVVKRIADDHQFTIDVESQSGRGATFRVRLGPVIRLPVGTPIVREERRTLFPSRS